MTAVPHDPTFFRKVRRCFDQHGRNLTLPGRQPAIIEDAQRLTEANVRTWHCVLSNAVSRAGPVRGSRSSPTQNGQRATMQTPQGVDATHGGELFPIDESCAAL